MKKIPANMEIYYNNKKGRQIDWLSIVKELNMYVNNCDAEKLEYLKWEALRRKKNYNGNNLLALYAIVLSFVSFAFGTNYGINSSTDKSYMVVYIMAILSVTLLLIPIMSNLTYYSNIEHYFDIYYRMIEQEIENRTRARELKEKAQHNTELLEAIKYATSKRSLLSKIHTIFKN